MVLTRKGISASSEAIIKRTTTDYKRKITRKSGTDYRNNWIFINSGYCNISSDSQHAGSKCNGGHGSPESTKCCTYFWNR